MTTSLRRMSPGFSFPAIVILITLGASAPSTAEPVAITSGFFQVHSGINEGFFTFEGDGFFFTGVFDGIFGSYGLDCDGCAPGTPSSWAATSASIRGTEVRPSTERTTRGSGSTA